MQLARCAIEALGAYRFDVVRVDHVGDGSPGATGWPQRAFGASTEKRLAWRGVSGEAGRKVNHTLQYRISTVHSF